jgi:hypothetical protein
MNTKEARVKTSGRRGHGDTERGLEPACDRDLPWRSDEILRDLGLSKEKNSRISPSLPDTDARNWPNPAATGRAAERRPRRKL